MTDYDLSTLSEGARRALNAACATMAAARGNPQRVAQALRAGAAALLAHEAEEGYSDAIGHLSAVAADSHGMTDDEVQAHLAAGLADALEWRASPPIAPELPVIRITGGEIDTIVDLAEAALLVSAPDVYRHGYRLVRPVVEEMPAADMTRTRSHRLVGITAPHLVERLTAAAHWQRYDGRSRKWVEIDCPGDVAQIYLAREGRWRAPPLAGVIHTPVMRADGSMLDQPGYDERTGLLYDPDGVIYPAIPVHPTRDDAGRALALLDDLISTFPFVAAADRAVALSAILSAIDRRAVDVAPLHAYTAPVAGSGKSMLVDLCSIIATGERAAVIAMSRDAAELEKRLVAALLHGGALIALDNVDMPLDSPLLCEALTSGTLRVRVLGASDQRELPNTSLWTATGNNLALAGDLTRRAVVCRLDPACERPELREFARHPPAMAMADRPAYVAAALTILRAYHVAADRVTVSPLGSYEAWSRRVREALVWLGCADPCDTIAVLRGVDPIAAALANVVQSWRDAVGVGTAITVQGLIEMADRVEVTGAPRYPDLHDALHEVAGDGRDVNVRRLGKWLARHVDRVIDRHRIERSHIVRHVQAWRLAVV
jgi:hypothetical protein